MLIAIEKGLFLRFSQIAVLLISMLKTSKSTESTTRLGKSRVEVGGDGVDDAVDDSVDDAFTHLNAQDELINKLTN